MRRILLTCPPMIGMRDQLRPALDDAGFRVDVPDFEQTVPEARLIDLVPDYEGWIIGDDPATAAVLEAGRAGRLRACVKWGVGTDNVDFGAAERLGLPAANTPRAFGDEVADIAMGYVTALARQTFRIDRGVRAGGWPKPRGISLKGRKLALVGFGDIGHQAAKRFLAAGLRVHVADPAFSNPSGLPVVPEDWPAVLDEADFLVFTCPLTSRTRHMLNRETLRLCHPGLRVVNVSRGPVIDEAALIEALESGRIHSAALDVFEAEPLPADSPLRQFETCIFGSHNASNTEDAVWRTSLKAIELLQAALDGGA